MSVFATTCNRTLEELGEAATTAELPLFGSTTFHQFGLWICLGFASAATAVAVTLIFLHATHYSKPNEQRHIIRILTMIPIYSVISFVSYLFYKHAIYWQVIMECYEAFAIASFFHLLCNYVEPTLSQQKQYFRTVTPKNWVLPLNWFQKCTGGKEKGLFRVPRSGLTWFNIIWVGVFQYCVIRVLFTFVALITQLIGRYCDPSNSPVFAHVWVLGFDAISVAIAMYCLIQFYVQLREDLKNHRPFLKILCIKLVIFFSFWQNTIISFLSSGANPVITTGPRVSYVDVKIGIPRVLLCVEMAIFAIIHIFAFPWRPYDIKHSDNPASHYSGGFLGSLAIIDALNPIDVVRACARGFRWLFIGRKKRMEDSSYKNITNGQETAFTNSQYLTKPPHDSQASDDYSYRPYQSHTQADNLEMNHLSRNRTHDSGDDRDHLLRNQQQMPLSTQNYNGTSTPPHPPQQTGIAYGPRHPQSHIYNPQAQIYNPQHHQSHNNQGHNDPHSRANFGQAL